MEYGLVVRWLAVLLALGLAGLPLAARLFEHAPARVALALPLSLSVVGVVTYWVGHRSLVLGMVAGLLVLGLLSVLSIRGVDRGTLDLDGMAGPVVVFTLAFLFMVAVRALDPAVHPGGGEKFLDFGLLKSLSRTSTLPPEDFWFAGEPVRYYYGGHLLTTVLADLTVTEARHAYNLALAGFFGMVVTAAYGLAGTVAAARDRSARTAGAFAAVFVGFASNLEPAGRALLWALPDGLAGTVAATLGVELVGLADSLSAFSYWNASRVIPGTVNEFPLFAWLNGDLHAHMMSTPFLLLVAGLWLAYYRTPAGERGRRRALVFGAVPPVAGLLAVVNTWSLPTAVGLGWLALTFADGTPLALLPYGSRLRADGRSRRGHELRRAAGSLAVAAVVALLAVGWSLPFWFGSASGRAIAFLPDRSALGPLVVVHGAFLLVFVPYLLARARSLGSRTREAVLVATVGSVAVAWLADAAALAVFGPLLLVGWLLLAARRDASRWPTPARASATGERGPAESDGGSVETGVRSAPDVGFETLLLVAGCGLVLVVEFVYLREGAAPGRFNTVFKTYAQVWVLFGTAAGAMAAWLADVRPPGVGNALARRWRVAGRALLAVVVVATGIYGALALTDQVAGGSSVAAVENPTLDARAFVAETHPDEAAAIGWLDNRTGQPNIVSAPGCGCTDDESLTPYRWANAPSSLTGVPTVAGWNHAGDYHGSEAYRERVADIATIYEGPLERRAQLLDRYDVRYIYVGPNERAAYDVAEFGRLRGTEVAFGSAAVTVYRVDRG